jgi:hypothetical protein
MAILKIKEKSTNSIIEIISFNIDDENNVLIVEDGQIDIISLDKFKDMTLGTNSSDNSDPTYEIYSE